jgi:hypothetical protein
MSQISPPIRILLVCAVAFMAAWMLFLRPKSDAVSPAASNPAPAATTPVDAGGPQAQSAAGQAVEQANDAAAAQDARTEELAAATGAAADTPTATTATPPADDPTAAPAADQAAAPAEDTGLPLRVLKALGDKKVVVLLFWNPKSYEDKIVRHAIKRVDRHKGKVVVHVANVKAVADYAQITRGANVEQSPSVVVVDRDRAVTTLTGFNGRRAIDQVVADAVRTSRKQ